MEFERVDELISLILGRELKTPPPLVATKHDGHTLLELNNVTADVFKDISLTVGSGEIVGLYGAIGAGHFDLARSIFGMYRFDSGTITVDGHRFPTTFSASYAIKHGLAYATESRRKVRLQYLDLQERSSERTVRPLGCFYWSAVWTLSTWCETRQAFRSFRIDRIRELTVLDERFRDEPGKTLADLFREHEASRAEWERPSATEASTANPRPPA